jgi:hypothetical protein
MGAIVEASGRGSQTPSRRLRLHAVRAAEAALLTAEHGGQEIVRTVRPRIPGGRGRYRLPGPAVLSAPATPAGGFGRVPQGPAAGFLGAEEGVAAEEVDVVELER